MKRYEAEIEVVRVYNVPIFAESLSAAGEKARQINTAIDVEELGESQDHEINLVGVARQKDRKMYQ